MVHDLPRYFSLAYSTIYLFCKFKKKTCIKLLKYLCIITFNKLNVSSDALIINVCSSEFFPCNELDTLLLTIKAFSMAVFTFSASEITIWSRFIIDDLKKVEFPKINDSF